MAVRTTKHYQTRRMFNLACPNCKCSDSRAYAWCAKKVFEHVCGACGWLHCSDKHGDDLRIGEVVPWQ